MADTKWEYFNPNDTYDNAIAQRDISTLRGLLVSIIGSDPTFATQEYVEAKRYIKEKSIELLGMELILDEPYSKQENETYIDQDDWDEDHYQKLIVWLRDNYAPKERLEKIREVGSFVYKDKLTYGKAKYNNHCADSFGRSDCDEKKGSVVITAGNDKGDNRLSGNSWIAKHWTIIAAVAVGICAIVAILAHMGGD